MLKDPEGWRRLVREYADLRNLDGHTPQSRGQQFNGMIAKLLTIFGVPARANQRSLGELDVTFLHKGRPFILEAKWEQRKTGTGPIAKLQRRVEQRMAGVVGVFLAMAGYTPDALDEVDRGRRLDIVLLDRNHWEAMLSGFVPPDELLDLVLGAAAFHGRAFTSLGELLNQQVKVPTITFPAANNRNTVDRYQQGSLNTFSTLEGCRSERLGVSPELSSHGALVVLESGVLKVDSMRRRAEWAAPVAGCTGSALMLPDRSILIARAYGIGRYFGGDLSSISSGAVGPGHLLSRPDGSIWCFDPGSASSSRCLVEVGDSLGVECVTAMLDEPTSPADAVWLSNSVLATAEPSGEVRILRDKQCVGTGAMGAAGTPTAVARFDEGRVLVASDSGRLSIVSARNGNRVDLDIALKADEQHLAIVGIPNENGRFLGATQPRGSSEIRIFALEVSQLGPPADARRRAKAENIKEPGPPRTHADAGMKTPIPTRPVAHVGEIPPALRRPARPVPDPARAEAEARAKEERRGRRDGTRFASRLPLYAYTTLAGANFDLAGWLVAWREGWRQIASGEAPNMSLAPWLLGLARFLGSYAVPPGFAEARTAPSQAYLVGFAQALRSRWQVALRTRLVPGDPVALNVWLNRPQEELQGRAPIMVTLKDLSKARARSRNRPLIFWSLHLLLLFGMLVSLLTELAVILDTVTGSWSPPQSTGSTVAINIVFGAVAAGFVTGVVIDARWLIQRGRGSSWHPTATAVERVSGDSPSRTSEPTEGATEAHPPGRPLT